MKQADRLILNVLSNYLLTLVAGMAGLVMVPVVMSELGAAGYGLASLLLAVFLAVQTLFAGVNRALQRFIPQDLAGDEPAQAGATFSSGAAGFALLGVAGAALVWIFRGVYLDAPEVDLARRSEALTALVWVLGSLALTSVLNVHRAGLEALQRYDLISLGAGLATAVRALLVIGLFQLGYGSIVLFVVSHLVAAISINLWCRRALRREAPLLRPSWRSVSAHKLRLIAAFSTGVVLIALGNLMGTEGFRLLIGNTLGMAQVGMLSALLAFRTMASTLIENMSNVLTPAVSTLEARGASSRVGALLVASTRYASVSAALVCVVPLAVATSFLTLWLGEQARPFAAVMYAILIGQIPVIVSAGAQQVIVGLGKARLAGVIAAVRGAAGLGAALLYLSLDSDPSLLGATLSLYAVQVAGGLTMLYLGARETGVGVLALFRDGLLRPLALALMGAAGTALVAHWFGSSSWWSLALCLGVGELIFAALVVTLGIDAVERRRILDVASRAWGWART